ncbi:MAG: thermonuclease family protein [Alphaproteobacteria bacterium]|nr:thermonuclease family protein [Alphaproteobacteria bacterium]
MKKIVFLPLITLLFASAAFTNVYATDKAAAPKAKVKLIVTEVLDGDTIRGVINCQEFVTIRLADIDCAEKSKKTKKLDKQVQEWNMSQEKLIKLGKKSKEKLEALLKTYETEISFAETPEKVCKTGNGDRLVGIVYAKDINVNEFMLKEGKCRPFTCADR